MLEMNEISVWVEKIRPWPWKKMATGATISFLLASAVSTLIGYMLMDHTTMRKTETVNTVNEVTVAQGPTLNKAAIDKILERNLFNSEGLIGDVDPNEPTGSKAVKSQLPIRITGIIYGGTPTNGLVMIENTQKHTVNSFLVGDILAPEATVVEIQIDQILIDNQGRLEYAVLEEQELRRSTRKGKKQPKAIDNSASLGGSGYALEPPPETFKEDGFERKGTQIEMTQQYKNRLLTEDFANVLQDAKASPNLVDGVLRGWKLDRIRKNSIYEKFGMQNGDIIEEINGVALSDASQAIKTLQSMRNESELDFKVTRNGQKMNLSAKVR